MKQQTQIWDLYLDKQGLKEFVDMWINSGYRIVTMITLRVNSKTEPATVLIVLETDNI